ncbi:MAG: hypothetical protein HZA52_05470 [Planctomycetes bacterium]|nr:hypothetical protein [Planctomycetota bacterium]
MNADDPTVAAPRDAVPAASLVALIRRATWRARAVTLGEATLAGLAVTAVVATTVRFEGRDELELGSLAAAVLAGAAAALTWWVEHRPEAAKVARRVDRALARGGELVTAWELESRAERGVLEELMLLRAREGLAPQDVARSVPRPSLVFAGAALVALAGWFFSRDFVRVRPVTPLDALVGDARALASSAKGRANSPELDRARAAVARLATRVATELEAGREPEPELVAAFGDALGRSAAAEAADPERAARARELAARARSASAGSDRASNGSEATSNSAESASALANGGAERTMLGPGSGAAAAVEVTPEAAGSQVASAPTAPPGSLAGRWWSTRHDAVVSAWIEARRARAQVSPNETTRSD